MGNQPPVQKPWLTHTKYTTAKTIQHQFRVRCPQKRQCSPKRVTSRIRPAQYHVKTSTPPLSLAVPRMSTKLDRRRAENVSTALNLDLSVVPFTAQPLGLTEPSGRCSPSAGDDPYLFYATTSAHRCLPLPAVSLCRGSTQQTSGQNSHARQPPTKSVIAMCGSR